MKEYSVYILTNNSGTLYVGMTNNLPRRIYEHKNKLNDGFTKKYNIGKLVYFENVDSKEAAMKRERQLKNWHRQWKINLIESVNKDWNDLAENWFE